MDLSNIKEIKCLMFAISPDCVLRVGEGRDGDSIEAEVGLFFAFFMTAATLPNPFVRAWSIPDQTLPVKNCFWNVCIRWCGYFLNHSEGDDGDGDDGDDGDGDGDGDGDDGECRWWDGFAIDVIISSTTPMKWNESNITASKKIITTVI